MSLNTIEMPAEIKLSEDEFLKCWQTSLNSEVIAEVKADGSLNLKTHREKNYQFLYPKAQCREARQNKIDLQSTGDLVRKARQDVCEYYGISEVEMVGERRSVLFIEARRCFSCILKRAGFSTPQIGTFLCRDHSTILNLLKKFHLCAKQRDKKIADKVFRDHFENSHLVQESSFADVVSVNCAVAKQIAHRARSIETSMTKKLYRAHLHCVLVSVMAHYGYSYAEIAEVRQCEPGRIKKRCKYIDQSCRFQEILKLRDDVISSLDALRGVQ